MNLAQYLVAGKGEGHVKGFNDNFSINLGGFLEASSGGISINSGYRSVEHQQRLWDQALAKYGSPEVARKWVAPPGKSQHNHGNAADLRYETDADRLWAHDNAEKYGLNFRLGNEPWHIEASGQPSDNALPNQTRAAPSQIPLNALAAQIPQWQGGIDPRSFMRNRLNG